MQTESEIKNQLALDKIQLVTVFKQTLPYDTSPDPLEAFTGLFKNKPDGYWLVRESRVKGMISITFKLNQVITHRRFAFVEDHWNEVGGEQVKDYQEGVWPYLELTQGTVKTKIDLLLETVFKNYALNLEQLILPKESQASKDNDYSCICPYEPLMNRINQNEKIYANLIESLKKIEQIMIDVKDSLNEDRDIKMDLDMLKEIVLSSKEDLISQLQLPRPFQNFPNAKQFKDVFANWLSDNNLMFDLFCPIQMDLFEEPYYILESGHVFDSSALFANAGNCLQTCPLTRVDIKAHPIHFDGYRRELNERLIQFFDLIQLYQEKISLNKEQKCSVLPQASNLQFFPIPIFPRPSAEPGSSLSQDDDSASMVVPK